MRQRASLFSGVRLLGDYVGPGQKLSRWGILWIGALLCLLPLLLVLDAHVPRRGAALVADEPAHEHRIRGDHRLAGDALSRGRHGCRMGWIHYRLEELRAEERTARCPVERARIQQEIEDLLSWRDLLIEQHLAAHGR